MLLILFNTLGLGDACKSGNNATIGSDNGLLLDRRQHGQAIVSTNNDVLLTGPRLNIKTVLSAYGVFHVKDKTAVRTSYL